MNITIFAGDITDTPAEAVCSSTNPRLSLMMGTGAAIRARGGDEILRECEALIVSSGKTWLPAGSVHVTGGGALSCKRVIHCVASDSAHRSSEEIVKSCVRNALACADAENCRTIAMPVFASGHARIKFERALAAMAEAIAEAQAAVERIYIVVWESGRLEAAHEVLAAALPDASIVIERSARGEDGPTSMWNLDKDPAG